MSNEVAVVDEKAEAVKAFVKLVSHAPPKDSVKNHPLASGVKFIPIGHIEAMMDKVFKLWRVEILREGQLLNSIYVTVRLHYLHPIIGEWLSQDGVGAVAIQTDKGKSAAELVHVKSNAIMLALPAAKSFAIKDAAEHIGKTFGRDINRRDTLAFSSEAATGINPTNQLVLVKDIEELQRKAQEYSGLSEIGAAEWFYELIGCQYSQVKKYELEHVLRKLQDERMV